MRITHVVDSMEVGGAETLVMQLCRLQREQGHEPSVCAVAALGALGERMRAEGFTVNANVGRHLADSALNFLRMFRAAAPDVVHLHNPTPTIYAALPARMAGVSSVISTRHSLVAPPRNLTMERKYRVAAKFCDWVVGICDATTRNVNEAGSAPPGKILRVYNGALPLDESAHGARPVTSGFTFLFVGRLEAVKNLAHLLEAFSSAVARDPELRLWIVGDGTERTRLEALAVSLNLQHHVRFWGQQLDVTPFFRAAHCFVMSSISEGLPMSLLQAFSVGLPAIVTEVGGMAEVVQLAQAGFTVPVTDVAAMASAMVRMARNSGERAQFSRSGKEAFRAHFTLEKMAASYLELYKDTARAKRRARAGTLRN